MTREEANNIKEQLSQILDDIAGNPDWQDAAMNLASDIGTLERNIEKMVVVHSVGLDEIAKSWVDENASSCDYIGMVKSEEAFRAGAEWMAKQGETHEAFVSIKGKRSLLSVLANLSNYKFGDKVIIQIRKK